ncbi:MAG: hypothetical protein XD91_0257 [Clostridiales bacterium 38_11]|nr:MAG: hypothetical protein XD91_0257 [Clostridiales bacterium 38_11]HBH13213.1 hypothetical protein [Clostridiales bacterium]
MSQNKKSGSLLGTIIIIYILFLVLSSFLGYSGAPRKFSSIIAIVVVIAVASRVLTLFKNKQPIQYRKAVNQSGNQLGEKGFNKDFGLNEIKNIRIPADKEFIKIDPKDHYHQQYKELYDAGIITKEELRDRITKKMRY